MPIRNIEIQAEMQVESVQLAAERDVWALDLDPMFLSTISQEANGVGSLGFPTSVGSLSFPSTGLVELGSPVDKHASGHSMVSRN